MTPDQFAVGDAEGRHKTTNAVIGSSHADDDFVVDDERRDGAAVFARLVGNENVPEEIAISAIDGEQVSVVGDEEDFFVKDGNATIGAEFGIAIETGRLRARVFPKVGSGEGINGDDLIGCGEVQDAVGRKRRGFQAEVLGGIEPFQLKAGDVGGVDLFEMTVAIGREVAIVGEPVARRWFAPGHFDRTGS